MLCGIFEISSRFGVKGNKEIQVFSIYDYCNIITYFICAVTSVSVQWGACDCYYKVSRRNLLLKYADPIKGIDYFFFSKLHVSCLIAIGDCILKLMHRSLNLLSADDAVSEGE